MSILDIPKPHCVTDADHSSYSPSGSKRWINCTASIEFIKNAKKIPSKPSSYANEGTAAHLLGAHCLENGLETKACIGHKFNDIVVNKDMATHVKTYTDYVNNSVTWDSVLWIENILPLDFLEQGSFGTADAVIVSDTFIEIIDLKYGQGVAVEVEENPQLMIYALGVLHHLKINDIKFEDHREVKLTIVQPRGRHDKGPIRSWNVTVEALRNFSHQVKSAIEESKSENAQFRPDEEICRWCEAKPICRAYSEFCLDLAKLEFADLVDNTTNVTNKLPKTDELSLEEMSLVLKHSKAILQWIDSIETAATIMLRNGVEFPNYKLVYGRSNRAWSNSKEVYERLISYGTDEDRLYTKKFISPSQAEKELTKQELDLVKDLIFKPEGKVSLAHISDTRPSIDFQKETIQEWANEDI